MVSQVLAIDGSEMDKKLTLQSKGNDFKISLMIDCIWYV